jgi:hypothetical protein
LGNEVILLLNQIKGKIQIIFWAIVLELVFVLPFAYSQQDIPNSVNIGSSWLLDARYGQGVWALSNQPDPLQTEFTSDDYTKTYIRDTLEAIKALQINDINYDDYESLLDWVENTYFGNTNRGQAWLFGKRGQAGFRRVFWGGHGDGGWIEVPRLWRSASATSGSQKAIDD